MPRSNKKEKRSLAKQEVRENRWIMRHIWLPDTILGTVSSLISTFGMLFKVVLPIVLGVTALLSPGLIFALSCTDLGISLIWWAHAHYDMYNTCKPAPSSEPLWKRIKSNPYFNHFLTFVILALFNIESALSLFLPALLGIASPIMVIVGFSIFSARSIGDSFEALWNYRREKADPNTTADELNLSFKKLMWTLASTTAVVALTVSFGFLLFSPLGPTAMIAVGLSIAAISVTRLVLRLINPNVSVKSLEENDCSSDDVVVRTEHTLMYNASLKAAQNLNKKPTITIEFYDTPPVTPTRPHRVEQVTEKKTLKPPYAGF